MPFLNNAALNNVTVDGAYVYQATPTGFAGVGVPTSLGAIVGTAAWGPLNTIVPFSDTASLYAAFGSLASNVTSGTPDAHAIAFDGYLAVGSGATNLIGIRVDNADSVAATGTLTDSASATALDLTAYYHGAEGNNISLTLAQGSSGVTYVTVTVVRNGYQPEIFPNIAVGTAGAVWTNIKNALNNGIAGVRGPSQLVTAALPTTPSTLGVGTLPVTITLTGGTNGTAASSSVQVGTDSATAARTGMYALRGSGAAQFILAGNTDSTVWGTMATFAQSEGMLAVCAFPSGTSTSTALSTKQTAGLASTAACVLKDWIYFYDPTQSAKRLVSPLGVALGLISSLAPEQSPGNKPVNGLTLVLGTERTGQPYSLAEAAQLQQNGIMYITSPMPRGGAGYGFANGLNSAAVPGTEGVNFTRMDNFIGLSIQNILGQYVDELQGPSANDPTRSAAKASLTSFLAGLLNANRIAGFNIQLDNTNNTSTTIAQGYALATVSVQFMGTIRFFVATVQGGAAVVLSQSTPSVS